MRKRGNGKKEPSSPAADSLVTAAGAFPGSLSEPRFRRNRMRNTAAISRSSTQRAILRFRRASCFLRRSAARWRLRRSRSSYGRLFSVGVLFIMHPIISQQGSAENRKIQPRRPLLRNDGIMTEQEFRASFKCTYRKDKSVFFSVKLYDYRP